MVKTLYKKNKRKNKSKKRGGGKRQSYASTQSVVSNSIQTGFKTAALSLGKGIEETGQTMQLLPLTIKMVTNLIKAPIVLVNAVSKVLMRLVLNIGSDLEGIAKEMIDTEDSILLQRMAKKLLRLYNRFIFKYAKSFEECKKIIQQTKKDLTLQSTTQLNELGCIRTFSNKVLLRNATVRSGCSLENMKALESMKRALKTIEGIERQIQKNILDFESIKLRTTQQLVSAVQFDARSPKILQLIVQFRRDVEKLTTDFDTLVDPNNESIKAATLNFEKIVQELKLKKEKSNKNNGATLKNGLNKVFGNSPLQVTESVPPVAVKLPVAVPAFAAPAAG